VTRNIVTEAAQLTLDFSHRPALGSDDFLVATPNAEAVRWLESWPDWPGPALVIHGAAGSGKTHLVQVFIARSKAKLISIGDLLNGQPPVYLGDAPAAVLEDCDVLTGPTESSVDLEEAILHLYNHLNETGRHLIVTAKQPSARWDIGLADLASRLNAAAQAGIGPPDDGLIAAVLVKQFADRQLKIDDGVISFMLARMERSFEAARRMVAAIDDQALTQHRNITVALVRQALETDNTNEDE